MWYGQLRVKECCLCVCAGPVGGGQVGHCAHGAGGRCPRGHPPAAEEQPPGEDPASPSTGERDTTPGMGNIIISILHCGSVCVL